MEKGTLVVGMEQLQPTNTKNSSTIYLQSDVQLVDADKEVKANVSHKKTTSLFTKKLFFFLKKVSYQPEFPKKKTPRLKLLSPQFHLPISLFPKQCQLLRFCPALVTAYQYTKVSSFSFS
jgi:hypothetical protein